MHALETDATYDDSLARRSERDRVARRTRSFDGGRERELVAGLDGCTAEEGGGGRVRGFGGGGDERGHCMCWWW
jgi:hypothetical protein